MKKITCVCILCLYLGINSYSQETTKLIHDVPVKKGKITLKDGNTEKFKHLKLNNITLNYIDPNGIVIEKNISDVGKIAKRSSCAGYGAIAGGVIMIPIIIQNEMDIKSGTSTADSRVEYLDFGIFFVGMGALVGSFFKKYKTIYEDKAPISFSPTLMSTPDGRSYAMLSLRLKIK